MAHTTKSNGANGTNGTNGYRNDSYSTTATAKPSTLSPAPAAIKEKPAPLPKPTSDGVSSTFTQFGQLLHASRRPLPTQHGDGTYSTATKKSSISKDLKYIGRKGMPNHRSPLDISLTPTKMSRQFSRLPRRSSRESNSPTTRP